MNHTSTILIVDDELGARKTLEGILQPHGYQLAFARNDTEALAQAAVLAPDLILLDVMMPEMEISIDGQSQAAHAADPSPQFGSARPERGSVIT